MEIILTKAFLIFFLAGVFGMIAHWAKRWSKRQTTANLYAWLFVNNPKYTVYSFMVYCGAIVALLQITPDVSTIQALTTAFLAGYGSDSVANDGDLPEIKD